MANGNSVHRSSFLVDLPAMFSSVSAQELLAKPLLRALMIEYWCWEQGMADWYARQPARRHRDFAGWIIEGRALFDRLDELKQLASGVDLVDTLTGETLRRGARGVDHRGIGKTAAKNS